MKKTEFFAMNRGKFFFNNPFKIAEYVKENCLVQAGEILKTANDVVTKRFLFNLRWDMERTHEPAAFPDEINWVYQPGDDPEWIYAFNRMRFWICLGQAYVLTKDEKYAKAFTEQICHWIKTVKKDDPTYSQAWRSIEVGLRLEYWLKAICYFESSVYLTDEVMELFCDSITEQAEFIMGIWHTFSQISNWGVLENHGLFLAGILLPESPRTQEYRDTAMERLCLNCQLQVYRDGVHWEQSPMYHNEVLQCFLDVILIADRNQYELSSEFKEKVRKMCVFDLYAAKPDHNEIAMGDSDEIDQRDIITKGALIFRSAELKSRGYATPDFDTIWDIGEKGLEEYKALDALIPNQTDRAFCDSGNFYARSDWSDDAAFFHFHCGPLGGGHGHGDKLHVDLFAWGEDILIDPGRYSYVFSEMRSALKSPKAHNTIIVDHIDYYNCKNSWECVDLTRGINQKFWSNGLYAYAEGGHLAYLKPEKGGVLVNRRVIFIKPDILVIADELYMNGSHSIEQYFHLNNRGVITGCGDSYTYQGKKARAEFKFLSSGLTSQIIDTHISRQYNNLEAGKTIKTSFKGTGFTSAFTVIGLSDASTKIDLQVEKTAVMSTQKGTVFEDDRIEAVNIQFGDCFYTLVIAHEEIMSPVDSFTADGCTGLGSAVIFDRSNVNAPMGTVLQW